VLRRLSHSDLGLPRESAQQEKQALVLRRLSHSDRI